MPHTAAGRTDMTTDLKDCIRADVLMTVRAWRNTEWDATDRELIRYAFMFIRNRMNRGFGIHAAVGDLCSDAYRHMNA